MDEKVITLLEDILQELKAIGKNVSSLEEKIRDDKDYKLK
jgi:hypothetical protein